MSSYLDNLADALSNLGIEAFEAVKTTVDGDQPILVGAWVSEINGAKCGCLMMDGIGTKAPHVWDWINNDRYLKSEVDETADYLSQVFYNREDASNIAYVANEFDSWASHGHPDHNWADDDNAASYRKRVASGGPDRIYVLTDEGRTILRKLMVDLARERALA